MTQLQTAMASLMACFDKYAGCEGNPETLTKAELKTLLVKELPCAFKPGIKSQQVDEVMKQLDNDGDAEVNFTEFVTFVAAVTCICNEKMKK